jgi:hypothetical protein
VACPVCILKVLKHLLKAQEYRLISLIGFILKGVGATRFLIGVLPRI